MDFVWITLVVAAMVAMWWVAYRMEPHWSSPDGHRFLCTAQEIEGDKVVRHPRETRVLVRPDGALDLSQKRMMRRRSSVWTMVAKAPELHGKLQLYVVENRPDGHLIPAKVALRIPIKSRCTPVLDELVERVQLRARPAAPGSAAAAAPPDQG